MTSCNHTGPHGPNCGDETTDAPGFTINVPAGLSPLEAQALHSLADDPAAVERAAKVYRITTMGNPSLYAEWESITDRQKWRDRAMRVLRAAQEGTE